MAAKFKFSAKSPNGKVIKGVVLANSSNEVKAKLRSKSFQPISVKAVGVKSPGVSIFSGKKLNNKEFQVFLRQLSTMIKAGVPIVDSLNSLKQSAFSKQFVKVLDGLVESIASGLSLSDSMKKSDGVFGPMVINLVRAGEEGGVLDEVLDRLALFYEKRQKLKNKVKGALIYPVTTVFVAIFVMSAMLIFVVPKFKEIFESQGQELPAITQFVVNLSENFMNNTIPIFSVIIGGPVIFLILYRSGAITFPVDKFVFKIPLFGDLIKRGSLARLCRTLSVLLKSGVRLNESLEISKKTIENVYFQKILDSVKDDIVVGKPFSSPLKKHSSFFPSLAVQMVSTGEKTGNLDTMLESMADFYEDEVEATADQLTSLLEPMIIVVLGGMIGFLVVSMFMPIFQLGSAVG